MQALDEGGLVYLVLAVTNRDPDRFADPEQLDLGRSDNRRRQRPGLLSGGAASRQARTRLSWKDG